VPLTIAVKIALEVRPDTHWMAIMLGPRIDAQPVEALPQADESS